MKYLWKDYDPDTMPFAEQWLDAEAVRFTGCDDGWRAFYEYWRGQSDFRLGENYWCKAVLEAGKPFAVVAFCLWEDVFSVMEILVAPSARGQGKGSGVIAELLADAPEICGREIHTARAVIFPDNVASQKAFGKAGFVLSSESEDGDALYYVFRAEAG